MPDSGEEAFKLWGAGTAPVLTSVARNVVLFILQPAQCIIAFAHFLGKNNRLH